MIVSLAPADVPASWPHRDASCTVHSSAIRWHVQRLGAGPAIMLLHGAGAASHSWRDVAPILAREYTVVIPDLPGHGFTCVPAGHSLSLDSMAADVDALCDALELAPVAIVGHSAGGAVALRVAVNRTVQAVIGFNAALIPPKELFAIFTQGIQAIARRGMLGTLSAWLAESETLFGALMRSTGSRVSPEQVALYRSLATSSPHANALMTMFSSWDMGALMAALPTLTTPVTLAVGTRDRWVPPVTSRRVAHMLPNARVVEMADAGHLAHEEFPERASDIIREALRSLSVTGHSG